MQLERHPLTDLEDLVQEVLAAVRFLPRRFVLGLAGPPGAGKSTIAQRIVAMAGDDPAACVAPLDGFHRSNEELAAGGLLELKGTPETFAADAFVARLAAITATPPAAVTWPTYDRTREQVVPTGIVITTHHRLVVVEGNYLLLSDPPWDGVRPLLDAAWYVDVPEERLIPRLVARHRRHRDAAGAVAKVTSTDLPNAELIAATKLRADIVLEA